MSNVEITHMTSKGQVVIPIDIRGEVGAVEGTVFAVFGSQDTIVLKKIQKPTKEQIISDWEQMVKSNAIKAKSLGIKEEDVQKIIQKGRGIRE